MKATKFAGLAAALFASLQLAGCGDVSRNGRAPAYAVIELMEAASGAEPDQFFTNLNSDVITVVQRTVGGQLVDIPTVFNDLGRVTMRLTLRDQGVSGITATPSKLNEVTFTRYRVTYVRADGRNTPGVDVPYPFDAAATFTVPADGTMTAGFELVRINAKQEAPLITLRNTNGFQGIATIAQVTFYGKDMAGNDVSTSGSIGVVFGNFGDPQ